MSRDEPVVSSHAKMLIHEHMYTHRGKSQNEEIFRGGSLLHLTELPMSIFVSGSLTSDVSDQFSQILTGHSGQYNCFSSIFR